MAVGRGRVTQLTPFALQALMVSGSIPAISASVQATQPAAQLICPNVYFSTDTVSVTSGSPEPLTIVVYATFKENTAIHVAGVTAAIAFNQTESVSSVDLLPIPPGLSVTFAAITISNDAVSAPTTPLSIAVNP